MKRILLLAGISLLISNTLLPPYRGQSVSTIEGIVLESGTDRPLERVRVSLITGSEPAFGSLGTAPASAANGVTDEKGLFNIQVKPGRYRIVPSREGFVYARPVRMKMAREPGSWVQAMEGRRTSNVQLRMVLEGVIAGRVLDTDGQPPPLNTGTPIPSSTATVTILQYQYDDYGKRALNPVPGVSYASAAYSFVRPNDLGNFRLYGLQPGDYYLLVRSAGPIGAPRKTYFPGASEESKAAPIHVAAGEQANVGTITIPSPKINSAQVRFRITSAEGTAAPTKGIHLPDGEAVVQMQNFFQTQPPSATSSTPIVLQMVPGHYEVMATAGAFDDRMSLYSPLTFDVGFDNLDVDVVLKPTAKVTTNFFVEDSGGRRASPSVVRCRLRSEKVFTTNCSAGVIPDFYELELPTDMALISAKAGDLDIRAGLKIDTDTAIDVVMGPGGVVTGVVKDSNDQTISDAVVALTPDASVRGAGPLYRAGISDVNGSFELRAIAPGDYHLFAWSELEGAAYRNADFMKPFEGRGKPVHIDKDGRISMDVQLADEPEAPLK